jgi:hypothetical protein
VLLFNQIKQHNLWEVKVRQRRNQLGYVLAVVIIGILVSLGTFLIETSRQLAVLATSSLIAVVTLEAIQISMRAKRYQRIPAPCMMPPGEQKIFQLSIIWTISLILVLAIKWPRI